MSPHELACREIAGAMMALLPGLDANDQTKTEHTIGFYLSVFSNVVAFTGADMPCEGNEPVIELPLYVADFVPQLLESLFLVIDALKGHGGGGVDTSDTCAPPILDSGALVRPSRVAFGARVARSDCESVQDG
jgi:hypothetical protein